MGLKINSIAEFPDNVNRSYYLYILDYYNWDEPIGNTLRNSFDILADFATKNDAVVIQGFKESHFSSELLSWKAINGIDPKNLLPALLITTLHPKYFIDRDNIEVQHEKLPEDKLIFLEIGKICKTPQEVVKLIEKIISDITNKKSIEEFQIKSELKGGVGKIINDTLILEPNIAGIGININKIISYFTK